MKRRTRAPDEKWDLKTEHAWTLRYVEVWPDLEGGPRRPSLEELGTWLASEGRAELAFTPRATLHALLAQLSVAEQRARIAAWLSRQAVTP